MPGGSRVLPSGRCDTPGRLAAEDLSSCVLRAGVLGPPGDAQPWGRAGWGRRPPPGAQHCPSRPAPLTFLGQWPGLRTSGSLGGAVHFQGRDQRATEEVCVILSEAMAGHDHV